MATLPAERSSGRILTLDVIRGVAVMGIFSVNVVGFAMVEAAYFHPPTWGFDGLPDRLARLSASSATPLVVLVDRARDRALAQWQGQFAIADVAAALRATY